MRRSGVDPRSKNLPCATRIRQRLPLLREVGFRTAGYFHSVGRSLFQRQARTPEQIAFREQNCLQFGVEKCRHQFGCWITGSNDKSVCTLGFVLQKPVEQWICRGNLEGMIQPCIDKRMPSCFCLGKRDDHVARAIKASRLFGFQRYRDELIMPVWNGAALRTTGDQPVAHAETAGKAEFKR